jgi:hypothetical protein
MKNFAAVLVLLFASVGCTKSDSSALAFQADKADGELGINQHQEGFFILRYIAYRGSHRLGGTLNEVSIRNLSDRPLKVESLTLSQKFRDREITEEHAPIPYDGLSGSITFGNKPTSPKDIAPGEWMSFDFPTKDIREFKEGDKMYLTFLVSLRSGSQHYERTVEFTKTLVKSQLPSL